MAFKGYEKRVMEILIVEKLLKSLYYNSGIWSRVSGDTFRNLWLKFTTFTGVHGKGYEKKFEVHGPTINSILHLIIASICTVSPFISFVPVRLE